jgi:hypothetical protein
MRNRTLQDRDPFRIGRGHATLHRDGDWTALEHQRGLERWRPGK